MAEVRVGWYLDPKIGWVNGPIPEGAQTQPTKLDSANAKASRPDEDAKLAITLARSLEARVGNLESILREFITGLEKAQAPVSVEVGDADMTLGGKQ